MTLKNWSEVTGSWSAILIGNGASRAVSDKFGYKTLYERASQGDSLYPLQATDRTLFERRNTPNFELVLGDLRRALTVGEVLSATAEYQALVQEHYDRVRKALAWAVHFVHPTHRDVGAARLRAIGSELKKYEWVFSTNYDVLAYWAAMMVGINGFYDWFGGDGRQFRDRAPLPDRTKLLFLHGALHLYVPIGGSDSGPVRKRVRKQMVGLLDQLIKLQEAPLIVAEGTPDQKLVAMIRNDYLRFSYRTLREYTGPLVIFGSALEESDNHLIDALRPLSGRKLAVSVHGSDSQAKKTVARLQSLLDEGQVEYFRASSHPLGDSSLKLNS